MYSYKITAFNFAVYVKNVTVIKTLVGKKSTKLNAIKLQWP